MVPENPKVFISYSHDTKEYEDVVFNFANKLRTEGIDACVDLYEESPPEGWPRWMENQIRNSDFVLVLSSKSYYDKCYSNGLQGKGISWEVNIVYQQIYDGFTENKKFIPVFFKQEDEQYILTPLKSFTFYNVGTKEGFDKLYWRLRGVTSRIKPPLGELRPLPEKQRKTLYFTSPIDLEKWNDAGWNGMLYLFCPGEVPVLGFLYKNYYRAKSIFTEWKKQSRDGYVDDFINIDYIEPPFPKDCWIYNEKDRNYGKGYFVHIGPNQDESINRLISAGIPPEECMVAMVSRYQWMDEVNGSTNRDMFKRFISNGSEYLIMPIGIKNLSIPIVESNLIIDFDYSVKLKKAVFRKGTDLTENDICSAVLKESK